jgi:cell wall-associated NlpC family hydrolase
VIDGRKRITRVIAALGITTLGGTLLTASPSIADPDQPSISDVRARVDRLYHEAEMASERYNNIREDLGDTKARLRSLQHDLADQQAKVEQVRQQVAGAIVSQYQGQALSTTTQVFLSENPREFLDQIATVSAYNDQQSQLMANFATQAKQLEMRKEAAQRQLSEITEAKKKLAEEKQTIDAKAAEAKELLGDLEAEAAAAKEAEQRTVATSRDAERTPISNAPVSGRAAAAVNYALAQVGDAYVYGAAGPDAFDCSGLTMMAWAQAGVSLPHSSSAQMSSGPAVSMSALQPGDLVFYYSPVSHVGIYIGNGQIVHAANPSTGVAVAPVNSMPFSGAVRPG